MKLIWCFRIVTVLILVSGAYPLLAPAADPGFHVARPTRLTYVIVREFPHDPEAFTQGLAWDSGTVYEATGLYGHSSLRRVGLETGNVELRIDFDRHLFAEGITVYEDRIYQLTWKNNLIFQYDKHDFSLVGSWTFPYQGWGITHDNRHLIVSDGTAELYFLDPETLVEKRRILVRDDQGPVSRLNELEYIGGKIYANIWMTEQIALIDPQNGAVTGYLDLSGLSASMKNEEKPDVLNGIMHDPVSDRLFVTGKRWSSLFEIEIVPAAVPYSGGQ